MADVKDLFQIIAGKEVMIFDLKEALNKCQQENKLLSAEMEATKQKKRKGNGKDADKPTIDEPAKPTGS